MAENNLSQTLTLTFIDFFFLSLPVTIYRRYKPNSDKECVHFKTTVSRNKLNRKGGKYVAASCESDQCSFICVRDAIGEIVLVQFMVFNSYKKFFSEV